MFGIRGVNSKVFIKLVTLGNRGYKIEFVKNENDKAMDFDSQKQAEIYIEELKKIGWGFVEVAEIPEKNKKYGIRGTASKTFVKELKLINEKNYYTVIYSNLPDDKPIVFSTKEDASNYLKSKKGIPCEYFEVVEIPEKKKTITKQSITSGLVFTSEIGLKLFVTSSAKDYYDETISQEDFNYAKRLVKVLRNDYSQQEKLNLIKFYREERSCTLRAAKLAVEAAIEDN